MKKAILYYYKKKPSEENIEIATEAADSHPKEELFMVDDCIYIYYSEGAGKAKMGINFLRRN